MDYFHVRHIENSFKKYLESGEVHQHIIFEDSPTLIEDLEGILEPFIQLSSYQQSMTTVIAGFIEYSELQSQYSPLLIHKEGLKQALVYYKAPLVKQD